jgi:hypothetical protein
MTKPTTATVAPGAGAAMASDTRACRDVPQSWGASDRLAVPYLRNNVGRVGVRWPFGALLAMLTRRYSG